MTTVAWKWWFVNDKSYTSDRSHGEYGIESKAFVTPRRLQEDYFVTLIHVSCLDGDMGQIKLIVQAKYLVQTKGRLKKLIHWTKSFINTFSLSSYIIYYISPNLSPCDVSNSFLFSERCFTGFIWSLMLSEPELDAIASILDTFVTQKVFENVV